MLRNSVGTRPLRDRLWHELTTGADDLLAEMTAPSAFFPGRNPLPGVSPGARYQHRSDHWHVHDVRPTTDVLASSTQRPPEHGAPVLQCGGRDGKRIPVRPRKEETLQPHGKRPLRQKAETAGQCPRPQKRLS